jgi:hypothetical protein
MFGFFLVVAGWLKARETATRAHGRPSPVKSRFPALREFGLFLAMDGALASGGNPQADNNVNRICGSLGRQNFLDIAAQILFGAPSAFAASRQRRAV